MAAPTSIASVALSSTGLGFDGGAARLRAVKRTADVPAAAAAGGGGDALAKRARVDASAIVGDPAAAAAASPDGGRGKHGGHRQGTKNYMKEEAAFLLAFLQVGGLVGVWCVVGVGG